MERTKTTSHGIMYVDYEQASLFFKRKSPACHKLQRNERRIISQDVCAGMFRLLDDRLFLRL